MKEAEYRILENREIARGVFRMLLEGDSSEIRAPGQFVNLHIPGSFLRRPISVCDWEEGKITLIYKVVGHGTEELSRRETGEILRALTGLGNGYILSKIPPRPVLCGGGVGVPPLYGLCRRLVQLGKHPHVLLGFRSKEDVFYEEEFRALEVPVELTTEDGSHGKKGFVTELLEEKCYALCCGPEPMLRALYDRTEDGQFSFEERMGCGFGACMGCSRRTKDGWKRVCTEGPVFFREEIVW